MKKAFTIILLSFFLAVGLLLSCKSNAPLAENKTEKIITVKEIVKDTVLKVEKDSSFYQAYIDCVNGKPVIKTTPKGLQGKGIQPETKKGNHLKPPNVAIDGNTLKVSCYQEAQELFFRWKEQYIKEFERETKTVPPVTIERKFTWWETTQIWTGKIVIFLSGIVLIVWAIKQYFKIRSKQK